MRRAFGFRHGLITAVTLFAFATVRGAEAPAPCALTTNYRVNPLGIDDRRPALSWQLAFTERDAIQTAYQLQAAPSAEALQRGETTWDTGRVGSDQSVFVPYGGPELRSGQRVYWHVRAWNRHGNASGWSSPAWFETGLLAPADWHAKWVTADAHDTPTAEPGPGPLLRKGFVLHGQVRDARLYVTSLGLYDLRLNGRPVTNQVLTPGWTSYHKRLQYQVYEVTRLLHAGENAVGAVLGEGWYRGAIGFDKLRNHYGTRLALLLQLRVTLSDGRVVTVGTDASWKTATGPLLAASLYDGETYDARLEKLGWAEPGYDDRSWGPVNVLPHSYDALIASVGWPVRRTQEVKPVKMTRAPNGEMIFDLGQNMVGWVRLKVHGPAGTTVVLRHAEMLNPDGSLYTTNLRRAAQTDTYILRGAGEEVHEPSFTFHGFRYVGVSGYPGNPPADAVTGIVVHSGLPKAGQWESSSPLLNQLVRNTEWGQRGNFVDVPTDCPQRDERLGWTGDAQVFARTAAYNFNVAPFFAKWLGDVAADQKPNGGMPWVIPDVISERLPAVAGEAGWGDAAVVVPWTMYQTYGDVRFLQRQYASMRAWVEHVHSLAPAEIWNQGHQFGDWLAYQAPDPEARWYPGATTGLDLVATAYFAHSADLLSRAAHVLGRSDDEQRYRALAESVRAAFNREFVTENGRVGEATQTAYALALGFDLLPEAKRAEAARRLAADVERHGHHLTTGFLGTPQLCFALSNHGYVDTAYALLNQQTYPSWLYPVTRGATSIWERWDGVKPDGTFAPPEMNSFNHYAYGAVVAWMYSAVAGIQADPIAPGYKRSRLAPQPGPGLTAVHATVQTLYGELGSGWERRDGQLRVRVAIPPNTAATVVLPSATVGAVREGDAPLGKNARQEGNAVAVDVGAGTYEFAYPFARPTPKHP